MRALRFVKIAQEHAAGGTGTRAAGCMHRQAAMILKRQIDAFVEHYNHVRYHESLNNLTPCPRLVRKGRGILAGWGYVRVRDRASVEHHIARAVVIDRAVSSTKFSLRASWPEEGGVRYSREQH